MVLSVLAQPTFGQNQNAARPAAKPTPRNPDGTVMWGPAIGEKGLWNAGGGRFADADPVPGAAPAANANQNVYPGKPKVSQVPFQPWSKAVYDYRQQNQLEPYTRCKPSGAFRQVATAYGTQFVSFPELKLFIIFQTGGSHSYRTIYMDGRQHSKDLVPSYYGENLGHFEGDSLVVDTIGYNERMWVSNLEGMPASDKLHTTEKFTRTDYNTMTYDLTIDDPGTYTKTWKTGWFLNFSPGVESFEYICQDNNKAFELMTGASESSVSRESPYVP